MDSVIDNQNISIKHESKVIDRSTIVKRESKNQSAVESLKSANLTQKSQVKSQVSQIPKKDQSHLSQANSVPFIQKSQLVPSNSQIKHTKKNSEVSKTESKLASSLSKSLMNGSKVNSIKKSNQFSGSQNMREQSEDNQSSQFDSEESQNQVDQQKLNDIQTNFDQQIKKSIKNQINQSSNKQFSGEQKDNIDQQNQQLSLKKYNLPIQTDQNVKRVSFKIPENPKQRKIFRNFSNEDNKFQNFDDRKKTLNHNHSEESRHNNQASDVRTGTSTTQFQVSVIDNKKKNNNSPDIFNSRKTISYTERQNSHYQTDIKTIQKDEDNLLNKDSLTFESETQKKPHQKRKRYNPLKDPNFDLNANQYQNNEWISFIEQKIDQDHKNSNQISENHEVKIQQTHESNDGKIKIQTCKLKRQNNSKSSQPIARESQIGGGKKFRESQLQDKKKQFGFGNREHDTILSKIKVNISGVNLSVIQSETGEEEESSVLSEKNATSSYGSEDQKEEGEEGEEGEDEQEEIIEDSKVRDSSQTSKSSISSFFDNSVFDEIEKSEIDEEYEKQIEMKLNNDLSNSNDQSFEFKQSDNKKLISPKGLITKLKKNCNDVSFKLHQKKYMAYIRKSQKEIQTSHMNIFQQNHQFLLENSLPCIKYNYCINDKMKTTESFLNKIICQSQQCFLKVKGSMNKDPEIQFIQKQKKSQGQISEITQQEKEQIKQRILASKQRVQVMKSIVDSESSISKATIQIDGDISKRGDETAQVNLEIQKRNIQLLNEFKEIQISKTFNVSEIEGIIFGGMSSRFWMLRKHINSLNCKNLKCLPFQNWNCITLLLKSKCIDIVLTNDKHMQTFLQFLIYQIKSLNGMQNSALKILEKMNHQSISSVKSKYNELNVSHELKIMQRNELTLYQKVFLKYRIMVIRSKISFMALQKGVTITELILSSILKTWKKLVAEDQKDSVQNQFKDIISKIQNKLYSSESMDGNNKIKIVTNHLGVEKVIKINVNKQQRVAEEVKSIVDTSEYYFLEKNQSSSTQGKSNVLNLKYQFQKKQLQKKYDRIQFLLDSKLTDRISFVILLLKKIDVSKKLFLLDIEQSKTTVIPRELRLDNLPNSFQYYDPILRIIQSKINPEFRQQIDAQKSKLFQNQIFNKNTIIEGKSEVQKSKTEGKKNENYRLFDTIQNSHFIKIKQKINRQLGHHTGSRSALLSPPRTFDLNDEDIQYKSPREMLKKQQHEHIQKSQCVLKYQHIKHQSYKQKLMDRIKNWIDKEVDQIYHNDRRAFSPVNSTRESLLSPTSVNQVLLPKTTSKNIEFLHKQKLKEQLLNQAEQVLDRKYKSSRQQLSSIIKVNQFLSSDQCIKQSKIMETKIQDDIQNFSKVMIGK